MVVKIFCENYCDSKVIVTTIFVWVGPICSNPCWRGKVFKLRNSLLKDTPFWLIPFFLMMIIHILDRGLF